MTEMNENSEEALEEVLARAKAGDRAAFGILYRAYVTPLYRYVIMRLGNVADAEDVVQETFMRAYQAIGRYREERTTMLPYLFTIARNLLINHVRKKRPDNAAPEDMDKHTDGESASAETEAGERSAMIRGAMEHLSDTEYEVIELKFFGERSYAEIAEILGKREDAIRQHVARSIRKLRAILDEAQQG